MEDKIKAIYEEIEWTYLRDDRYTWYSEWEHPVMIWDVLDWIDVNISAIYDSHWGRDKHWEAVTDLIYLWKTKRATIEEQSDECIDYIFNLIK